jgi:hypothetical protein
MAEIGEKIGHQRTSFFFEIRPVQEGEIRQWKPSLEGTDKAVEPFPVLQQFLSCCVRKP